MREFGTSGIRYFEEHAGQYGFIVRFNANLMEAY